MFRSFVYNLCDFSSKIWHQISSPMAYSELFRTFKLERFANMLKGALSGLRQFLATESPLKMTKNAFYFTSKALSGRKIFKYLSRLFAHVSNWLDWKDKVNFKFYDVAAWLAINCNTHKGNQTMKLGQLIEYNMRNIFL